MRANSAVNWARGELPQPRSWKVTEKRKGKEEKMLLRGLRVPCSIFCVPRLVFRVSCSIRHARTSFENFGCERGLRLSTHWQWSVMVTGEQASKRAIEQSSNRAHDQPDNQFIHPMHGSVLHPALSRVLRTRTYITRARNMYDVLFCESQLVKTRAVRSGDRICIRSIKKIESFLG